MKKIFALGLAMLLSAAFANEAAAQGPPPGMMPPQPGFQPSPYGWHPKLQGIAFKHGNCAKPGIFSKFFGKAAPASELQGGTLVFPNNPFTRSPRDFFMLDQ